MTKRDILSSKVFLPKNKKVRKPIGLRTPGKRVSCLLCACAVKGGEAADCGVYFNPSFLAIFSGIAFLLMRMFIVL